MKIMTVLELPLSHCIRARQYLWRPEVKGLNAQVDSIYNGWRTEEVSFDK